MANPGLLSDQGRRSGRGASMALEQRLLVTQQTDK